MTSDRNKRDQKYRRGYIDGFHYAILCMQRGDTADELSRHLNETLIPWEESHADGEFGPAPGFKK